MSRIARVPFYYVRHGQTDWNRENRAMGQMDIPLNEQGLKQALAAREALAQIEIRTICHSPLSRAKATAEIFQEVLRCPLVEVEELQEFNLGAYAGQTKGPWYQKWRSGEPLKGAEPYRDFMERCLKGINKALSSPGLVLIVAHGGVYWSIQEVLQMRLDPPLSNGEIIFHCPPRQAEESWEITRWGDEF